MICRFLSKQNALKLLTTWEYADVGRNTDKTESTMS